MYSKVKILKAIRKELEAGNQLIMAVKRSGLRSRFTLNKWRENRPLINRYILKCLSFSDTIRITAVEDGHFKKMIEGKASASDYEFYLTRRASERWPAKDNSFNIMTHVHNEIGTRENLKDIPLPALKRIIEYTNNGNGKIPDNGNGTGSH